MGAEIESEKLLCILSMLFLAHAVIADNQELEDVNALGGYGKSESEDSFDKQLLEREIDLTQEGDKHTVRVAGMIEYNGTKDEFMTYAIRVYSSNMVVPFAYCDTYDYFTQNAGMLDSKTETDGSVNFIYKPNRNAALMNQLLGGVPLRCSVYAHKRLRHFRLRYINSTHGGVEYNEPTPDAKLRILDNWTKDANHLVVVLTTTFFLTVLVLTLVPLIMCCIYRKTKME